jgi:hypothetical protein
MSPNVTKAILTTIEDLDKLQNTIMGHKQLLDLRHLILFSSFITPIAVSLLFYITDFLISDISSSIIHLFIIYYTSFQLFFKSVLPDQSPAFQLLRRG